MKHITLKHTQVMVKNAERMMLSANIMHKGLEVVFADGINAVIPFQDLEIKDASREMSAIELPNPYEVILKLKNGKIEEIPWDFARQYCDTDFTRQAASSAAHSVEVLGSRIRKARVGAGLTQDDLATKSGLGRVTLARIELGQQSPRFDTIAAIAQSLNIPIQKLLVKP